MRRRSRINCARGLFLLLMVTAVVSRPGYAHAQDVSVPAELQLTLFVKILTFDRNLRARVGDELVIGVVYQGRFKPSIQAKDALFEALDGISRPNVNGVPLKLAAIDIEKRDLSGAIRDLGVDIVYVAPLRAVELESITSVTRSLGIVSITGVESYAASGVSVAIGVKAEKSQIVINVAAARAEGADFSSKLLQLSRIVREE